jgi:hypothetical protein
VLFVGNLADTVTAGTAFEGAHRALRAGIYDTRDLLTGRAATPIVISEGGRIERYVPFAEMSAKDFVLLELARRQ